MSLIFEQIRLGGDRNFGYLLADREAQVGVLIDPAFTPDACVRRAFDQGVTITHVINTHSHSDHTNGNSTALALTHGLLAAHPSAPTRPAVALTDADDLYVGVLHLMFLHVPGHCPDHIVVYETTHQILLTGDLLFVGKVGGTATDEDARIEWHSLQRLLESVPDEATVWPGHDYGVRPSSTIGLEKAGNPFLQCRDVEAFVQTKRDWPAIKQRLGLL